MPKRRSFVKVPRGQL